MKIFLGLYPTVKSLGGKIESLVVVSLNSQFFSTSKFICLDQPEEVIFDGLKRWLQKFKSDKIFVYIDGYLDEKVILKSELKLTRSRKIYMNEKVFGKINSDEFFEFINDGEVDLLTKNPALAKARAGLFIYDNHHFDY